MTFLEQELLNALRRLEEHYQERERVQEQNLRSLCVQVEHLARQVNALTQSQRVRATGTSFAASLFPCLDEKWWEWFYGEMEQGR